MTHPTYEQITAEEKRFLIANQIPFLLLFDARGRPSSPKMATEMKEQGKLFAYNATPCKKKGHRIRTRAGHCIQCDTARIAFMLRMTSYGFVYIAGTLRGQLIKIGATASKNDRAKSLNRTGYASYNDWEVLYTARCVESGAVEIKVHRLLQPYRAGGTYFHDNHNQSAMEIFRCSYRKSRDAVLAAFKLAGVEPIVEKEKKHIVHKYDFRNLIRLNEKA